MPLNKADTPSATSLSRKQVENIVVEEIIDLMLVDDPSLPRAELRKLIRHLAALDRKGDHDIAPAIDLRRLSNSELERELELLHSAGRALAIFEQRLMAEAFRRAAAAEEASS